MKFILLKIVKLSIVVGILTFINRIIIISKCYKAKEIILFQ